MQPSNPYLPQGSSPGDPVKGLILHTREVARRVNQSESTVRGWAQSGKLPRPFKMGKFWCFWERDINDYIRRKSEEDPSG
jgi:excisionase family DNA binding protein